MLVDTAKIKVQAGNGGYGHVSFRREKNLAKGGPDGGDGGAGGSVCIVANANLATLADFRSRPFYKAQNGVEGGKSKKTGAGGADLVIEVPTGTLIYEKQSDGREILVGDLTKHKQMLLVASGGVGGVGNHRFKSSTNRTPMQFTYGTKGEVKALRLEVKLIADVGLVGLPNAGKSTLINQLTSANAKVGNYPFTTLSPNLGVCKLVNEQKIIIADIPGLIEGASLGRGLGDEFLRHVERTRLIVHVVEPPILDDIDAMSSEAYSRYEVICKELSEYSDLLANKEVLIVINKVDITEVKAGFSAIKSFFASQGMHVLGVSAVTGEGVEELKGVIMQKLANIPKTSPFRVSKPVKIYDINTLPNKRMVFNR
jgi:GTPase